MPVYKMVQCNFLCMYKNRIQTIGRIVYKIQTEEKQAYNPILTF